jgi:hypothetical protein
MSASTFVFLIILISIAALVLFMLLSQSDMAMRTRRLIKMSRTKPDDAPAVAPRPNAQWDIDPDRTNEAREIERQTGVIRKGSAFSIVSNDAAHWGVDGFDVEGLITAVAECETVDAGGNFQFRYCLIQSSNGSPTNAPNTMIIEGDVPDTAVVFLGRAYSANDELGGVRVGSIINQIEQERERYRVAGVSELTIDLPPYEQAVITGARYDGNLALLEYEPGSGYLPVSASNPGGARYADLSVRLDPSGWYVRLIEVGAYKYLLELEPIRLRELTVHHLH